MTPEMRVSYYRERQQNYYDIMRTTLFSLTGIAAIIAFGPGGYSASLAMLVIGIVAYGILAGNSALTDLDNLRNDMDDATAATHYGRGSKARNIGALKMITSVLLLLVGVAELYELFT